MSELSTTQREALIDLASRVREHFDEIEQDVPEQSFLVGGAVRDALLGRQSQDMDFVVVGETPESMLEHGFDPIEASSFPVLHDGENEEWSLARTEEKSGEGYTGFDVFTDDVSLRDDLERRDLTINAMALSADPGLAPEWILDSSIVSDDESWGLIDPHGGVEDLRDGVLRHVSEAFADDPLRVLRVARYAARFEHFEVADETVDMMRQVVPELNRMSRDRIGDEIVKAMEQASRPSRFWEVLRDSGALAVLWPELDRGDTIKAGPEQHHAEGSTFRHTMMSIDRMDQLCRENDIDGRDRVRRLFAILGHDIGKVIVHNRQ